MNEITDKIYDHGFEDLGSPTDWEQLELRCRECKSTDTLVENTMVPRSMGAELYRNDKNELVVSLNTGDDNAYWEAESDHQWGCSTCVSESIDLFEIFEIIEEPEVTP